MPVDVEVTDLCVNYGETAAADHVSFEVDQGEFFSLLGPSGCGKSTVLRSIAGFVEPTSGTIKLRGHVVNDLPPFKRNVGMVFQHLALFPHMNVQDNLAFGLKMKKTPKEQMSSKIESALSIIGLPGFQKRKISQLSGGQMQRVALARALVTDPTVLLLDEPLGALDLKLRLQLQVELKKVQKRVGTTFIFVTHDQGEALTMSDRIAIMHAGKIVQIGGAAEIYMKPHNKFVADFIGETNLVEGMCTSPTLVDCRTMQIRAECEKDFVGRNVLVSVRPERILVGRELKGLAENVFDGTIQEALFKGSFMAYRVKIADGPLMNVQVQNLEDVRFNVGDSVQVGWRTENSIVVAA